MSAVASFTCFKALPPELRLQIWGEALSVRFVWAAIHNGSADLGPSRQAFAMDYIGPAPYLVGMSCREAWRLLEQSYVQPLHGPFSAVTTGPNSYWVDLDATVVYLGDFSDATTVLNSFDATELSKFKHVALPWYQYGKLAKACQRLAALCPVLRTLIIQHSETELATNQPCSRPLSPETAAYYTTIPEYAGPELRQGELDVAHLRSLLLEYFGDTPPRLHLVSLDSFCNRLDQKVDMVPSV